MDELYVLLFSVLLSLVYCCFAKEKEKKMFKDNIVMTLLYPTALHIIKQFILTIDFFDDTCYLKSPDVFCNQIMAMKKKKSEGSNVPLERRSSTITAFLCHVI